MAKQTSLSVIVPVYNERFTVAFSLKRLLQLAESPFLAFVQVLVVDDCSRDIAPNYLPNLLQSLPKTHKDIPFSWHHFRHPVNKGKGQAIRTGLEHVTGELTIIHDADMEYNPRDILPIIDLFVSENADAVLGSRFLPHRFKRALYFRHELGNKFLTFLVDLVTDLNLTDVETCYKCVRSDLITSIPLFSRDFCIEVELVIKLAKRQAKIFETPISYLGRTYEEGKKINWWDGVKTLFAITRFAFSGKIYKPDAYGNHLLWKLSRAHRFTRWMADTITPYLGKAILEIGSGNGQFTRRLMPRDKYYATDINPLYLHSLAKIRDTNPLLAVEFLDINDVSAFAERAHFDTVIALNVLENEAQDRQVLANIYKLLQPGGRAIVHVPHWPYLYGPLDKALGHRRRYSRKQLQELAHAVGFEVIQLKGINRFSTLGWLLHAKLLRKKSISQFHVWLLNLLTPIIRRIDRCLPIPPLSLIGILQKPKDRS